MAIEGLARAGDPSQMSAIEAALKSQRDDRVIFAGIFASAMLENGSIERITGALLRPKQRELAKQYLAELARGRANVLGRYAQDPDPRRARRTSRTSWDSRATRPRCRSSNR